MGRADGGRGGLAWLHLGDEFLVEETSSLLVKRAVDGDDVTSKRELVYQSVNHQWGAWE